MKPTLLVAWLCLVAARIGFAEQPANFQAAASAWEAIADSPLSNRSSEQSRPVLATLEAAWQTLSGDQKEAVWPTVALAHFRQSEAELAAQNAAEAANELRATGALYQRFNGRVEYATKSPDSFFPRLARLQAGVAQATGADPLAGMVDYLFRKEDDRYIVARQELDSEVKGVTVEGIGSSELLAQVLQVSVDNRQATIQKTWWIIGPKGPIEETVRRARAEIFIGEDGRLSRKSIATPLLGTEEGRGETATPPTPNPSVVMSNAPATARDNAPAAQKRTGMFWPSVIAVAVLICVVLIFGSRR